MGTELNLGRKGKFGEIDFSKLKSGITKNDLNIEPGSVLESIFNSIDTNKEGESQGKLDRNELNAFINKIKELCAPDTTLSKREAKKFEIDGEKLGKNKEELLTFLDKLSELTNGIKKVETVNDCETIHYENGNKEEIFSDGTKTFTDKDGNITKFDKDGKKTETIIEKDGVKTTTSFKDDKKTKETIVNNGKEEIIIYSSGNPIRKTVIENNETTEYKYEENKWSLTKKTTADGKVVIYGKDGTTTKYSKDGKNFIETRGNDDKLLNKTVSYTNNNQLVKEHTEYNENDYTQETTVNDIATSQKKKIGGITYNIDYVEYDSNNSVGVKVIVQNGETLENIANKFGCTVEELIKANPSKLKRNNSNQYFNVGEEIIIPKKLEADNKALQGRKSKDEAIKEYNETQKRIKEEQERIVAEKQAKAVEEARIKAEQKAQAKLEAQERENKNIQKESAKQIVNELKSAIKGLNDFDKINQILTRIDDPIEFDEVNRLLAEAGYEADDLYSSIEKFISQELQRVKSDLSCEELETLVQKWINDGILIGQAAIDAQARLAARIICDAGDGFGTDCDMLEKGISMIKDPAGQDSTVAQEVYKKVNDIIANHNTFYGIGTKCKDLVDYLEGEVWDHEIKKYKGILAKNGALDSTESANAVNDLIVEAISGVGTSESYLKQALMAIKTPKEREDIEAKLINYCEAHGIKPKYDGQSYLQAILYAECDTFMGINSNHEEIRKFNEMLIAQGAYTEAEAVKIRAEQAALQIFEGDFTNIYDAVSQIKDKAVYDQLFSQYGDRIKNSILNLPTEEKRNFIWAEFASNNFLDNNKAAEVAFKLIQSSDFDTRAQGLKAIRNEEVANTVDEKLKASGSSLEEVYVQFNNEKKDYKSKAKLWDGLAFISSIADHISDEYRKNTDISDNIYVESTTATEIDDAKKINYNTAIQIFEDKLEEMKKAYQEALDDQGVVSDAVNLFCERYNIGTTRDEIEARIEHDTETLRLLKLAAEGKLSKIENGKTVHVDFEDVFKERQSQKITSSGVVKEGNGVSFDSEKVEKVSKQAERMYAMELAKDNILIAFQDLNVGIEASDQKILAIGICNTLEILSKITGNSMTLESMGYSLEDGFILDSNKKKVNVQDLKLIANSLKKDLIDLAAEILGAEVSDVASFRDLEKTLNKAYDKQIEGFKKEFEEAFGQIPNDEMIEKYIKTINTGKNIVNIGAIIGVTILTAGQGTLAMFAAVAGTSFGLNALEKSTDADGYTMLEFTSDAEQAIWDGALTVAGYKIGSIAEQFAKGSLNIAFATKLLTKNKNLLSKFIKSPNILEKAAVWVARVEAAGFEISSDTLQSLVQMYCQEGKFDEQAFVNSLIMSAVGNVAGHVKGAVDDVKPASKNEIDLSHLSANERRLYEESLEDTPTPKDVDDYLDEVGYKAPTPEEQAEIDRINAEAEAAHAEAHKVENNAKIAEAKSPKDAKSEIDKLNEEIKGFDNQIKDLEKRIENAKKWGKNDTAQKLQKQVDNLQKLKAEKQVEIDNLKKNINNQEEVKVDAQSSDEPKVDAEEPKADEPNNASKAEAENAKADEPKADEANNAGRAESNNASEPKSYSEMTEQELLDKYLILAHEAKDSSYTLGARADKVKELNKIKKILRERGFEIDGTELKQTRRARRANRPKTEGIRAKYGAKIARAYNAVLQGIESMKTKLDFDRLKTRINEKFAKIEELKNDLMAKLKAKAEALRINMAKTINPDSIGSKYFNKKDLDKFVNENKMSPQEIARDLQARGFTPTLATDFRYPGDEFISYKNTATGELYTYIFKDGKLIHKSYVKGSFGPDGFNRQSELNVDYENNMTKVNLKENGRTIYNDEFNTLRAEAYSKFNKRQQPESMPKNGVLDGDAQYLLDPNDMPRLRLIDGTIIDLNTQQFKEKILNLKEGEFLTIGRDGDVQISDSSCVSRHHILITKEKGKIQLKDISTGKNTKVMDINNFNARNSATSKFNANQPSTPLQNGRLDQNAQYELYLNNLPRLQLRDGTIIDLTSNKYKNAILYLRENEFITIGRNGYADIGVSDSSMISRHHLVITKQNGKIIIKDVSSYGDTNCYFRNSNNNGYQSNSNNSNRSNHSNASSSSNRANSNAGAQVYKN